MDLNTYLLIWICILGLCFGSFFNVVILRSLSGESIIFPPSKCPKCGNKLYFWHNIPILSFIILRGRCYFCKEKINIQYPLIELSTMFLYAFSFLKFGISYKTLFVIFILSCLLINSITDIKTKIVDCHIPIILGFVGLVYACITFGTNGFLYSLLGMASGILIIETVARLGYLFTDSRAMGEADTYVAGALGAVFGLKGILYILFLSLIISMILILPMYLYKKIKSKDITTCISFLCFILSISAFYILWHNLFMYIFVASSGIYLAINILKGVKNKQDITYLPFVPALSLSALLYIFLIY